jgi:hypothetical protein
VNNAASRDDLLDDFLFQEGDSAMASTARRIFGVGGRPVIIGTETLEGVEYADHKGDALASVLRVRVEIAFLAD